MGKLIGLGIVGAAVFLGAVVVEVTRRIKEEKERAPRPSKQGAVGA